MQVLEVYKPFEIQEIDLDNWQQRPVKNNFFELVLIKEGKGTQCINYNFYPYEKGSMFLLPPLKCHSFQIEQPTRFVFLKFTSDFFSLKRGMLSIKASGSKKQPTFYPITINFQEISYIANWIANIYIL